MLGEQASSLLKGHFRSSSSVSVMCVLFYAGNMDWSNELIFRFLAIYKRYNIIWDPNHPEHKNKSSIMDAWEQLRLDMGTEATIPELKRKKDALMATYRNLQKKVQMAKEDNYKPSWFCYEVMNNFLHNIYKPRMFQDINEDEPSDFFENSKFEFEDFELPEQDLYVEEKPPINIKKRKVEYEDVIQPELVNMSLGEPTLSSLPSTSSYNNVQNHEPDEISLYGELLITKLRKFDRATRLIICNKIDNLLFQSELKLLNEDKSSYYDPLEHDSLRNGKTSIKKSSSYTSLLHSESSDRPQSD